jgi:hypothetical protein
MTMQGALGLHIPKLAKDGSNIFHWEQAFSLYAQSQNFLRLLTDSWEEPECERSVGTVFQLPSPDAIYSQDEGKERRWSPSLVVCVRAGSMCC